jgi:hypothetical protein
MESLSPDDLVVCDKVHVDKVKEGVYLAWSSSQRWSWLSGQTSNEAAIFMTWDSRVEGTISGEWIVHECPFSVWTHDLLIGCAHGSFEIPSIATAFPRESIEVRIVVVYDENGLVSDPQ